SSYCWQTSPCWLTARASWAHHPAKKGAPRACCLNAISTWLSSEHLSAWGQSSPLPSARGGPPWLPGHPVPVRPAILVAGGAGAGHLAGAAGRPPVLLPPASIRLHCNRGVVAPRGVSVPCATGAVRRPPGLRQCLY